MVYINKNKNEFFNFLDNQYTTRMNKFDFSGFFNNFFNYFYHVYFTDEKHELFIEYVLEKDKFHLFNIEKYCYEVFLHFIDEIFVSSNDIKNQIKSDEYYNYLIVLLNEYLVKFGLNFKKLFDLGFTKFGILNSFKYFFEEINCCYLEEKKGGYY